MVIALLTMLYAGIYAQTPKELVEQGEKYYEQEDYVKAVDCFRRAAEQGDAEGQLNYGAMFFLGKGVEQNYKTAFEWILKSANNGNIDGQNDLGYLYENGFGIDQNYNKALEWYKKASDNGSGSASQSIAMLYWNGNGVEMSKKKSAEWSLKGAEQGDAGAQYGIGYCYENGYGVEQNTKKAIEWYTKAAEQGDEDAMKALDRIKNPVGELYYYYSNLIDVGVVIQFDANSIWVQEIQHISSNFTQSSVEKIINENFRLAEKAMAYYDYEIKDIQKEFGVSIFDSVSTSIDKQVYKENSSSSCYEFSSYHETLRYGKMNDENTGIFYSRVSLQDFYHKITGN